MRTILISATILLALAPAWADKPASYQLPLIAKSTAVIDGKLTDKEYPAGFTEPGTGIRVSWQADSANICVCLRSPGKGWVSIGFGSEKMKGSLMVMAYQDGQGKWLAEEQLGKMFFQHKKVDQPRLVAGAVTCDQATILEFCLPRALSNGKTITTGAACPFILAFHQDKPTFSKHTKKLKALLTVVKPTSGK